MTEQTGEYNFFVYIVESPSAPDIYHGRSEGELVARAIQLDGIPCIVKTAINAMAFGAAFGYGLPEAMKQFPDRVPIVHISAHGSSQGIQLSSTEEVSWSHLRLLLEPINRSLDGFLLLCMSACEGYSACQMAMQNGDAPHPYFAMVGNYTKPTWSDTTIGYACFYHLISKGYSVIDAVGAMRIASGSDGWVFEMAEDSKRGYLEYISSIEPTEAQQELSAAGEASNDDPNAKALALGG
jgi:hypothetical protein